MNAPPTIDRLIADLVEAAKELGGEAGQYGFSTASLQAVTERKQALLTHVTNAAVFEDHQISKLITELTRLANEFHGHQSIRQRIAALVIPAIKERTDHTSKAADVATFRAALRDK